MSNLRKCFNCNREVRGRVDKKFCSDQCRNDYNNQLKVSANNNYVRNINRALKSNRRILEELMNTNRQVAKVNADKLNSVGFKFKYFTHTYTTKKGTVYYYVYEYGYLALENNWYLLVKSGKKRELSKEDLPE